jgi:hypothetical protein
MRPPTVGKQAHRSVAGFSSGSFAERSSAETGGEMQIIMRKLGKYFEITG